MRNALNRTDSLIYSSLQYQAASSNHVSLRFVFIQIYLALYFLGPHITFIRPALFQRLLLILSSDRETKFWTNIKKKVQL